MRVIALFRVSTEKQASEGASLDAQERAYRVMADRNGWTTVQEFRGSESASGASSDRRVLQQVLACIRETEPDAIWVYEQSRLTRGDELEVAGLLRELREREIKILVNGVVRDLGSIDERFMVGIQSLVDRAESERIKERMHRGKRERAKQGKKNSGPAAFGYLNPFKGMPGHGTLQVVEEQARAVRFIFEKRLEGHGEKAIAKMLNERGVKPPRSGQWGGTTIRRILQNPLYIGTQASNVWVAERGTRSFRLDLNNKSAILIPDAHPAIIDRATWDAIHGLPKQPRAAVPRMLTGLLHINGHMAGGDSDCRKRFYSTANHGRGLPWLEVKQVEDAVWDAFASLTTGPEFVERLMRQASNAHEQEIVAREIEHLEEQIRKTEKRLDNLLDMRANQEIDRETYATKSQKERQARDRHRADLVEQRSKAVVVDATLAQRVVRSVQTVLAGRTRLTGEQKRAILRSVVKRIDIDAAKSGAKFTRDSDGRINGSGGPAWRIERVTIRVAVGVEGTPHGESSGTTHANWAETVPAGASRRTGQLRTTYSNCAQVAGTDEETRTGQLRTTFSCSGRRGPARP